MSKLEVGDLIPIGAIGSAKSDDVLEGKTYSSDEGVDLKGTMKNRGKLNKILTNEGDQILLPEGYYSGGDIKTQITNLAPENIKEGVNVGGVVGEVIEHYPNQIVRVPASRTSADISSYLAKYKPRSFAYLGTLRGSSSYTGSVTNPYTDMYVYVNGNPIATTGWGHGGRGRSVNIVVIEIPNTLDAYVSAGISGSSDVGTNSGAWGGAMRRYKNFYRDADSGIEKAYMTLRMSGLAGATASYTESRDEGYLVILD